MPHVNDQAFLLHDQYRDSANLEARVRLHRLFSTNPYGWNRWCFDQLDLPDGARVLEIGCGPGHLWRENLDRLPTTWQVTLSDLSAGMLDRARANLNGCPFDFRLIDAQSIPFEDDSFDAVIANHMLYHVPDLSTALAEIRRVLKPAGAAYLATNGDAHLRELHALLARFDGRGVFDWNAQALARFSLDGGGEMIGRVFSRCEVRRYLDNLIVTAAAPLIEYILSLASRSDAQARRAELTAFIATELQTRGSIFITKDSGLFIAQP